MFAAGADIKEMAAMSYQDMAGASHLLQESFNAVAGLPMPVVAAVTGFALGRRLRAGAVRRPAGRGGAGQARPARGAPRA